MMKWKQLRTGDRVRLIELPHADLEAYKSGSKYLQETLDVIQRMIDSGKVLTVEQVDEYGHPWVGISFVNDHGETEEHTLTITDDKSWIPA